MIHFNNFFVASLYLYTLVCDIFNAEENLCIFKTLFVVVKTHYFFDKEIILMNLMKDKILFMCIFWKVCKVIHTDSTVRTLSQQAVTLTSSVAEFKEFERRFKFKPRCKYGWFHLKFYQMFQNFSRRLI